MSFCTVMPPVALSEDIISGVNRRLNKHVHELVNNYTVNIMFM